mmetsp:Transcript_3015/g.4364  ORF Transcript_3015/g.4364 Transcript_3015/m.4364 type:complete len:167 (+) Transcript_3015:145-645(+)|eukprot:CAMPEP_0184500122 /NCGR_PEP_ID=MMETSP0113_2-20130426/43690_1 /TAXON_ID=91329 /ORGANISM="Norrisiella sphaerica, Strain BC52" /LENGTH=166 /DNA_ID=CAMNT_0026888345 /DNA_START=96 /DNA_END=599 /DNA_ORIENTATION=-
MGICTSYEQKDSTPKSGKPEFEGVNEAVLRNLKEEFGVTDEVINSAVENLWKSADVDTDGGIDCAELEKAMKLIFETWLQDKGVQVEMPSDDELKLRAKRAMEKLDYDKSGKLEKKEFRVFVCTALEHTLRVLESQREQCNSNGNNASHHSDKGHGHHGKHHHGRH